ncbi:MAG: mandelate racemase/muconate lactonizing enzyme family protein [Opitutaceae bacterium]|nr:mandelate racemase/muconate lactonizing enzyme family protein [Opitutaceae bacterium]
MSRTRIKTLEYFTAESPLSRPIADATHQIPAINFVVARVTLEDGTTGEGYLLAFHFNPGAIRGALADVRALAVGREVSDTKAFNAECDKSFEYFGATGLLRWARGVVNLAMWDAWGRHLGQPVWRLLGTHARSVPVYGSGGWLSYSLDELVGEATGYVRRGFTAVKLKVGSPERARDLERIAKVREAVGPHVRIMIDANQGLDYPAALELALGARAHGIHWFEEPLVHTDFDGYAALRANAGIALAMGEREFDLVPLRELARRSAIDLWQPDILRLGGVEGWLESAALARAHHLPVLPHYYKEYDAALCCTIPDAYGVESFDWVDGLIDRPLRIEKGRAYPADTPGWGFSFRPQSLVELKV